MYLYVLIIALVLTPMLNEFPRSILQSTCAHLHNHSSKGTFQAQTTCRTTLCVAFLKPHATQSFLIFDLNIILHNKSQVSLLKIPLNACLTWNISCWSSLISVSIKKLDCTYMFEIVQKCQGHNICCWRAWSNTFQESFIFAILLSNYGKKSITGENLMQ